MIRNSLLGGLCVALLAACSTAPLHTSTPPAPAPKTAADAILQEAWVSEPVPGDELDSLVAWPTEDGRVWLIATAKATHHLALYDADTGQRLRTVGGPGTAVGQFNRPNGIAVFGDLLFVAERDNHRVQAFRLPEFAPLGAFGADVLRSPYGLWVHEPAPGVLELFVTDSFMADFRTMTLPPMAELAGRVKRFQVRIEDGGKLETRLLGQFGDTGAAGALRMVESIAGDPAHGRLLRFGRAGPRWCWCRSSRSAPRRARGRSPRENRSRDRSPSIPGGFAISAPIRGRSASFASRAIRWRRR